MIPQREAGSGEREERDRKFEAADGGGKSAVRKEISRNGGIGEGEKFREIFEKKFDEMEELEKVRVGIDTFEKKFREWRNWRR
jgi:hypothetical protein